MATPLGENPIVGYHAIRGLGAPLRMMMYYKEKTFTNVGYGNDMKEKWFGEKKPELLQQNACINLPYIVDGATVVTQSNTCMLYLGGKLGIDKPQYMVKNHTVLDQVMDLRNDLMLVVYPFGKAKTKEEFPEVAASHIDGSATNNFTKLEGFCQGPFMCGDEVQSGDFHLWEMLDQHRMISEAVGKGPLLDKYPKLAAMYEAMKGLPTIQKYLDSEFYQAYFHNNGLFTHFSGLAEGAVYPPTAETKVEF